jgi:glutathione S-transferase
MSSALENNYYWAMLYSRFDGRNWPFVRQELSGLLPHVLRYVLPTLMQAQVRSALKAQGLGRLTPGEIYDRANADMEAASAVLGSKHYLFGDQPSSYDASLFGLVHNVLRCRYDSPLKAFVESSSELTNYERRIREQYFENEQDADQDLVRSPSITP